MSEKLKMIIFGIFAGTINGLFGSGGGMIVVPGLERFFNTPVRKAHATAIGVIFPLAVVSALRYSRFVKIDFAILPGVCLGGAVGSFLGARLLKKFTSDNLKRIFSCVIIASALRMVIA